MLSNGCLVWLVHQPRYSTCRINYSLCSPGRTSTTSARSKLRNGDCRYIFLEFLKLNSPRRGQEFIPVHVNTLRPRQNGCHFPDIFKCIFLNEKLQLKMSLKFVPKGPVDNIPALVQIMAWRRPGDKPLSEPTMVSSTTYICVTWPQWINLLSPYWIYQASYQLVMQICELFFICIGYMQLWI